MKQTVLILILLISASCAQNQSKDKVAVPGSTESDSFDWLCGSWVRINDEEGYRTFEHWFKNSDSEYIGQGCTLQEEDTVFKEHLRLIKTGEKWNLEVTGVNEDPTLFLIIDRSVNGFRCENKQNEFPGLIEYFRQDTLLLATISGGDTEVLFRFKKD